MSTTRLLKIPSSDVSQFVIPCTEKDCSGETLVDLTKLTTPKEQNRPVDISCSVCRSIIQPPVTQLLRVFQDNLKQPLFYFLVPDTRE
jgi:hypothetical protein